MSPSTVGTWSLYTILFTGIMVLASLVLGVVLLVLLMMGRLRGAPPAEEDATPPADEAEDDDDIVTFDTALLEEYDDVEAFGEEGQPTWSAAAPAAEATVKPATEGDKAPPAPPAAKRKTGWWQLLAACLLVVPAIMVTTWVDNFYGQRTTFTFGAALNLLLLAGQVFLTGWAIRLQRRIR